MENILAKKELHCKPRSVFNQLENMLARKALHFEPRSVFNQLEDILARRAHAVQEADGKTNGYGEDRQNLFLEELRNGCTRSVDSDFIIS